MEFLITENQLRKILTEQNESRLTEDIKSLSDYTKKMVKDLKEFYNINLKNLLTFGASVGGLMMPLDNFITKGNFNLEDKERILVLMSVVSILLFENNKNIKDLVKKIEEEGLTGVFQTVLSKGDELKTAFVNFIKSFNVGLSSLMEMAAYGFLIPILYDVLNVVDGAISVRYGSMLVAERIIASGLVYISKEVLTSLIRKIVRRIERQ
jgi:hypothetical protein